MEIKERNRRKSGVHLLRTEGKGEEPVTRGVKMSRAKRVRRTLLDRNKGRVRGMEGSKGGEGGTL